jgi:exodeoxyribonuclease V gamma subunit
MSFILYKSNQLERLAEFLVKEVVRKPLQSPIATEQIIVQTQGVAQWLKLELCRRQGIAFNVEFPFPRSFLFQLMEQVLPQAPKPIEPEALTWRIMETIVPLLEEHGFDEIKEYLADKDDRRRFQLAERVANLFDQYSVYRPEEFIDAWLNKEQPSGVFSANLPDGLTEQWQAILWRKSMTENLACQGKFLFEFIEELKKNNFKKEALPERISIFGATSMPPIYLEVFKALGRYINVHLFWLSPCKEFWGHDLTPRESSRIQTTGKESAVSDLHLQPGHPLLASWGKTGRDFLNLVGEVDEKDEKEDFVDPKADNLLGFLQSGILHLEENDGNEKAEPFDFDSEDRSLQIHSCHSPLRELQVLRDQLLCWFSADKELMPDDIAVILPDMDAYAPYVKGVFQAQEPGSPAIPYTLADQKLLQLNPMIEGYVALLRLPDSRLTASSVMALFETAAVRRRFMVGEEEVGQIEHWLKTCGARWGRNAQHRKDLGIPGFAEHSWEHGRDRLLLGYAMADDTDEIVAGMLPSEGVEGTTTELLGRWLDFQQQLFIVLDELGKPRTLAGWADYLNQAFDTLFLPDKEEASAANIIRLANNGLRKQKEASGFNDEISLAVVLEQLLPCFEQPSTGKASLRGAVTFSGLNSVRSIPFKCVCMLGMQDGGFPRSPSPVTFDLMAKKPKEGDSSRREDDRYLFLETLLSARDRFYISYVGQSIRDNSKRLPSVVVSELLDFIDERCRIKAGETNGETQPVQEMLVVQHGLHPFSPAYFRKATMGGRPQLFSFSPANAKISQALIKRAGAAGVEFLETPLSEPSAEFRSLKLQDLQSFYRNPSEYFVKNRLEFTLPKDKEMIEDEEPFALDNLEKYKLEEEALDLMVEENLPKDIVSRWVARGLVPPASVGKILGGKIVDEMRPISEKIRSRIGTAKEVPLHFTLNIDKFLVEVQLKLYEEVGLVYYRPSKVETKKKPKPHLDIWLEHLALQLADWSGPKISYLIGEGKEAGEVKMYIYNAIESKDEVEKMLSELLEAYWQGLRKPLPFFPQSSFAFALPAGKSAKTAEERALAVWEGDPDSDFNQGEKEDPYFRLCFGGRPVPEEKEFQNLATQIVSPLLKNQQLEKE